uniref:Membrane protein n=1 Tax=Magnetospirillum gryphiswaldense TaxID=55518 RepID=A4TTV7_9PROT|nr:membrane protein [Magnetospirillum gryphiswaldense MSR-1]
MPPSFCGFRCSIARAAARCRRCLVVWGVVFGLCGTTRDAGCCCWGWWPWPCWGPPACRVDDDVRRQQALDPILAVEQAQLQAMAGFAGAGQFYLVRAGDTKTALRQEEALGERLAELRRQGALADWRSPARFVPSVQRQVDNIRLVQQHLDGAPLADLSAAIGLPMALAPVGSEMLELEQVMATGAVPVLSGLVLAPGVHLVALDNATDLAKLRDAANGLDGISFIDPVADMGTLLGQYRQRALWLLAISLVLMLPLLMWRYGVTGGLWVMVPPLAAILLTPLLLALVGQPFTFFAAMALILVASVGVEYADKRPEN